MTSNGLQAADLMADESLDEDLLPVTVPLPDWLSTAREGVRHDYREWLSAYHGCVAKLNVHLDEVLPSFEDFTRQRLITRIKAELGCDIDPELITLDLPKSASFRHEIDPVWGRLTDKGRWIGSDEHETVNLRELAWLNFPAGDEQMLQRLTLAMAASPVSGDVAKDLTAEYLHGLIPQLDIAGAYRKLLRKVFRLPEQTTEQGLREADLLLKPYEYAALLEGLSATSRRQLSEAGWRVFQLAVQSRTRAELDAAQVEMSWVVFKPGAAVSGDSESLTLSGLCAMRDLSSDLTLIYLPDAPGELTFIEASSLDDARSRLVQKLLNRAPLIDYLAERTLDTVNQARHVSYINQALIRQFDGFIRLVPALDLRIGAQQLQTRAWALHRRTLKAARSNLDLVLARDEAQNEQYLMYFKSMLALLPGLGSLISAQEGWALGHDAAQAFKAGRVDDGLLASGAAAISVLDVVLSAVPGAATVSVLTRMGRRASGLRRIASSARQAVLKAFEGYEVQTSLVGAIAQSGADIGTLLKDSQLWIKRQGHAYAVYRRAGEQTLRLKKTAQRGYEPPVRYENGAWVYHTDVGLKGGMNSPIAESIIANANPDPAFTRRQARHVLDQFDFPPDRQRRLELDVAVYYQKHRTTPDWAQAYRRTQPEPLAGPSGTGGKRKDSPGADHDPKRPATTQTVSVVVASTGEDAWKSWGRPMGDATGFDQFHLMPPTFSPVGRAADEFIQIGGSSYDILPSGSQRHASIVFLKNPGTVDDSLGGLNAAIRSNRFHQPIMASFDSGTWTVHGPMFKREIHELVKQARPTLTPASYRILAEKLFEYADLGHVGVTATRLIHMRATLNAWQQGLKAPLVGLADPLSMLNGSRPLRVGTLTPRLNVGSGPSLEVFDRLDFTVSGSTQVEKLVKVTTESSHGNVGRANLREFMSDILTSAGYSLLAPDDVAMHLRSVLLFKRPGHEQVYLLNPHRFHQSMPPLTVATTDTAIVLSNRWVDELLKGGAQGPGFTAIRQAREEGHLVKLIGGVKVTSQTQGGTQVFVQRIADAF